MVSAIQFKLTWMWKPKKTKKSYIRLNKDKSRECTCTKPKFNHWHRWNWHSLVHDPQIGPSGLPVFASIDVALIWIWYNWVYLREVWTKRLRIRKSNEQRICSRLAPHASSGHARTHPHAWAHTVAGREIDTMIFISPFDVLQTHNMQRTHIQTCTHIR